MRYLSFLIILFYLTSCTQEVRVVDEFFQNIGILASSSSTPSKVSLIDQRSGAILTEDIISANNDSGFSSIVSDIIPYDQELYFVLPEEQKIVCISKVNFNFIAEYDFTLLGLTPRSLCFPNASNGYVIFEDSDDIILIDRINRVISEVSIPLLSTPSKIDFAGNKVFILSETSNNVTFVGTNKKSVERIISVHNSPTLIEVDPSGNEIFVISTGYDPETDTKEIAKGTFISTIDGSKIVELELASDRKRIPEIVPYDFTYTSDELDFIFVTSDQGLIRIDSRNKGNVRFVNDYVQQQIFYDDISGDLIIIEPRSNSKDLITMNSESGDISSIVTLSNNTGIIYPNN